MNNTEKTENTFNQVNENILPLSSRPKKKEKSNISYTDEIHRKLIHLFSLNISLGYIHLDKPTTFWIMFVITIITVSIDVLSKKSAWFRVIFFKIFGSILRRHEIKKSVFRLNGASWLAISATMTILIFPKLFAVVALSILIISDISSALIGRKFGRTPFFKKKTLEGSAAFFLSASLVVFIYQYIFNLSNYFLYFGIASAFVTTFSEAISKEVKLDDNLLVPITFCVMMSIFELILNQFSITMLINF